MNLTQNIANWVIKKLFTSADLGDYQVLNRLGVSGTFNVLGFEVFLKDLGIHNSLTTNFVKVFKDYHFQKWEYSDLPESLQGDVIEIIEGELFCFGSVALTKLKNNDDFIACKFITKKRDRYGLPKTATLKTIGNNTVLNNNAEVGKDFVIIYDNSSFMMPNVKISLGPLFFIFGLLNDLILNYNIILQNITTSRNILLLDGATSPENVAKITNAIFSNKPVIALGSEIKGVGDRNKQFELLQFNDNTELHWQNYKNIYALILDILGIENDSSEQKKERKIKDEVNLTNSVPDAILQTEFLQRKAGWKRFNDLFHQKVVINKFENETDNEIEKKEVNDEKKVKKI